MEKTLGVKLTEGEEAEIRAFCSQTRMTPREVLLARARNRVPEVTVKALEEARHEAYMEGRAAACGELRSELAKAAEAVTRAQQLAERYAEGLAWLDTWYAQAKAVLGPKVPIPNDAIAWWKRCARAIL